MKPGLKNRRLGTASAVLAGLLIAAQPVMAQPKAASTPTDTQPVPPSTNALTPVELVKSFVTRHQARIQGQTIAYTATAGETLLRNGRGEPTGALFSFAYVKDGAASDRPDQSERPVLFVFNGGPGSSSLWLHMGVVGPRRVELDREINPRNVPPFGVVDNPYSLLDVADLVFIDPIGTGFSRIVGVGRPEDFFGVDEDADSVAQFIELWLSANGRWNAPKYVMGESYGAGRAAILPRYLMGGPLTSTGVMRGITLNGIILVGPALNSAGPASGSRARGAANSLPAQAAIAWYHNRIDRAGRSLEAFDAEVAAFAMGDYLTALEKSEAGDLSDGERGAMADRLAAYTGIPAQAFGSNLALSAGEFSHQLLADQGLALGHYDGRYTLPLLNDGGEPVADDPAMGRYVPGFVSAFHQMLDRDLKVKMDRPYGAIVWKNLMFGWNWKRSFVPEGQPLMADLATALRRNDDLKVLMASGYYDLVTTPQAAKDAVERAGIPADRVQIRNYESGHMLYLGGTAESFAQDVRSFIQAR